ncbi:MAG: hypothetical protein WKF81_11880, partial [Thermomicrobiales bacterium]
MSSTVGNDDSQFANKQIDRRGVLKGAAAAGIGAVAATAGLRGVAAQGTPAVDNPLVTPTADATRVVFWTTHSDLGFEALSKIT